MNRTRRVRFRAFELCGVAVLTALVFGEFLIFSPPMQRLENTLKIDVRAVAATPSSTTVHVGITGRSPNQGVRLAAFPLSRRPITQPAIYVYDGLSYPTAGVVSTAVQGVFYNLAGDLRAHQYAGSIEAVSADGLIDVLRATSQASGRAVVMMTGVLPAGVFSKSTDLLSPWVQAGGLVVWGGASIGYFSAMSGRSLAASAAISLGERGPERLLGKGVLAFPWVNQRAGDVESEFASALGLTFKFTAAGIQRNAVLGRGGLVLGWSSGSFPSVAFLPQGQGGYLLFGGEILNAAEDVSHDVAQILLSSALSAAGPVATTEIPPTAIGVSSDFGWDLPFVPAKGGIMVVAFDTDANGIFFYRKTITG